MNELSRASAKWFQEQFCWSMMAPTLWHCQQRKTLNCLPKTLTERSPYGRVINQCHYQKQTRIKTLEQQIKKWESVFVFAMYWICGETYQFLQDNLWIVKMVLVRIIIQLLITADFYLCEHWAFSNTTIWMWLVVTMVDNRQESPSCSYTEPFCWQSAQHSR